jgi:hypothetical protein
MKPGSEEFRINGMQQSPASIINLKIVKKILAQLSQYY